MASDEGEFRPPLPPEDRLWRHPSEVGDAGGRGGRLGSPWVVGTASALVGAGAALAVTALFGGLGTQVVERDVVERVSVPASVTLPVRGPDPPSVGDVTADTAPGIAGLELVGGEVGTASAVVLRDQGYLLTSAEVLREVEEVDVRLADGREFDAEVLGLDELTDVAVLRAEADDLPTAVLGSAEDVVVGEQTLVVGAPAGPDGHQVTNGIVSSVSRTVHRGDRAPLYDMIQTDAPTPSAAIGGALLDHTGAVVGITSPAGGDSGLTSATPIDLARRVADDIIRTGGARHVWLGISGDDLAAAEAEDLGVAGGAVVRRVTGESPADEAGLRPDDVILSVEGTAIESMDRLVIALRNHRPGETIRVGYMRDGQPESCQPVLVERDV